jgi:hypothetical protein
MFESMMCDKRLQRAYLVVDALDECITDCNQLLRFIARHAVASHNVKWIVSSRNTREIENILEIHSPDNADDSKGSEVKLSLEVKQNAEQVKLAVEAFIDHKLSSLPSLRNEHDIKRRVQKEMLKKADDTFLWVALVAKELENATSWNMLELVKKMPATLYEFYDLMMDRARQSDGVEWEYCQFVLSVATVAYRPLSLAELAVVSELPAEIFTGHANRVQEVVVRCGSFLTVKEGVVYLIHQSVKDYLTGRAAKTIFPSSKGQVHRAIFEQSVRALSTGLRRNMYSLPYPGTTIDHVKVPEPDPLAGIRYACVYWARHFCDAGAGFQTEDSKQIDRFIRGFFLVWLEAVALLQKMSESIVSIRQLETSLKVRVPSFSYGCLLIFSGAIMRRSSYSSRFGCCSICSL